MSQVTWLRGPVCGVDNCRSRLYRLSAGRKFCQFGHVVEGNFEFDDDDGIAVTQTRRLNVLLTDTGFGARVSQSPVSQQAPTTQKRLYGETGRVQYLLCVQYLLRRLVPEAVAEFYPHLSPLQRAAYERELTPMVRLVWRRCAAAALSGAMPANIDIYVFLYLAMRRLNHYPVAVDAYVAALKRNRLHYLGLYALLPPAMALVMTMSGIPLLAHTPAPLDDLFYRSLCRWLRVLPRDTWAVPADLLLAPAFRVFGDLHLGEAPRLLVVFHRLVAMVYPTGMVPVAGAASAVANLPECQFVAYLYLATKLFLMAHPRLPDPSQWGAWLDTQRSDLPCFDHKYHHMDLDQLFGLSAAQTDQYCRWVHDALVLESYKGLDELLGTMEKKLLRIFALDVGEAAPEEKGQDVPRFDLRHLPLLEAEVAQCERHLLDYFCYRFGLKQATLQQVVGIAHKKVTAQIKSLTPQAPGGQTGGQTVGAN